MSRTSTRNSITKLISIRSELKPFLDSFSSDDALLQFLKGRRDAIFAHIFRMYTSEQTILSILKALPSLFETEDLFFTAINDIDTQKYIIMYITHASMLPVRSGSSAAADDDESEGTRDDKRLRKS